MLAGRADVAELGELRGSAERRASICSNCVKPSTALSGVRSSWLMRERNCDLAWLSRSASTACWRASSACLALGDVPVDADAAHGAAVLVEHSAEREASQR